MLETAENRAPEHGQNRLFIAISREHGTNGKEIGRAVAERLHLEFYDKEELKAFALQHGMESPEYTEEELYDRYLSLDAGKEAVITQRKVIEKIAEQGSAVIVGRSADYILENQPGLLRVFLYAPVEYKVQNVMRKYGDTEKEARKHIQMSDRSRADYYSMIANRVWGDKQGYDLCINTAMGNEAAAELICTCAEKRSAQ